jgi:hypothetical protein
MLKIEAQEDEKEDVNRCWMTLWKRQDTETILKEEALDRTL